MNSADMNSAALLNLNTATAQPRLCEFPDCGVELRPENVSAACLECRVIHCVGRARLVLVGPEEWLPVVGFPDYLVSDRGRVQSLKGKTPRILKQTKGDRGYLQASLYDAHGKRRTVKVHTLVLTAFRGQCPDGMQACHFDDCKTHNYPWNLYWGNRSQNGHDSVRNGRHPQARKVECPQGHPYDDQNTLVSTRPNGRTRRDCRQCRRERDRDRRRMKGLQP